MDIFDAIKKRRSIGKLGEPAPNSDEINQMLEAAVLAPDHNELRPWRFVVLQGDDKSKMSQVLLDALFQREQEPTQGQIEKEKSKLERAPLVIAVAVKHLETKIPDDELLSAAAAATQNLLLVATALGYGSMWRTGEVVYDANIKRALGLDPDDKVIGFIYIGTPKKEVPPPKTPNLEGIVWSPDFS